MPRKSFVLDRDVTAIMTDAAIKGYTPENMEFLCPSFTQLRPYISLYKARLHTIVAAAPLPVYRAWLGYSLTNDLTPTEVLPHTLHHIRNFLDVLPYAADLSLLQCTSNQRYEYSGKSPALPIFFRRTSDACSGISQEDALAIRRIHLPRPHTSDSFTLLQVLTLSYGCCCALIHPQGIVSVFGTASQVFRTIEAFTVLCDKGRRLLRRFEPPTSNQAYVQSFYTAFALGIHQRISLPLAPDQLRCRLSIWNWISHDPVFSRALEDFYAFALPHKSITRDSVGNKDGRMAAEIVCLADALIWCDCLTCTTGLQDE
ncbi:hypothetical protein [Corynebacterium pseudotuberculosis]|uniref:hypothetical protein n=1 Tax=Corynebacterium pseudotuberculosis TaxID=1719 RepID=UPI0002E8FC9E|nr:hypothetical protein [Corynebacterium pseudotuberculosis]AFM07793.2 hypothetical protein CP162_07580 [Corynebacterium pseudotuberculosis Cp162]APG82178.1 Hypothetical protein CPI37_1533 [Corynebacterium pseudotuberculosis]WFP66612.1 hypothetical protein P8128_07515 [Corynebacterium pseudotuberculosis]